MAISSLWSAPEVNPVNGKARTLPILNPFDKYGRVFHFAWFGFFLAFWSWYAFPPLLSDIITKDMKLSKHEVANSNIIALTATLLVRLVAGPCCDRFGPRKTFACVLIAGAIPTFCAGGIKGPAGLYAVRFFIGILGGAFVPCQVWTTGFFDKNIIGMSNALTAGFGNAGGGVTYFVMPAIYNALVKDGEKPHVAWRVSFVVPGVLILFAAACLFFLCEDTPLGPWADRFQAVDGNLRKHSMIGVVDVPGMLTAEKAGDHSDSPSPSGDYEKKEAILPPGENLHYADNEAHLAPEEMMETAKGEVIRKPTMGEILKVCFSPQTLTVALCYMCTFGTELSVNSVLGTWYMSNFKLTLQESGNWAAMFGLLNVVFRPLGGVASDYAYRSTGSVWGKKILLHAYSIICGGFLVAIGVLNSHNRQTMVGLVAGMAFFLEGANGINYATVPHIHPYANGVVSGFTGAFGNLGGILFAIIFRFNVAGKVTLWGKSTWIIGVIVMAVNLAVCWIPPVPRGQIGGK